VRAAEVTCLRPRFHLLVAPLYRAADAPARAEVALHLDSFDILVSAGTLGVVAQDEIESKI